MADAAARPLHWIYDLGELNEAIRNTVELYITWIILVFITNKIDRCLLKIKIWRINIMSDLPFKNTRMKT